MNFGTRRVTLRKQRGLTQLALADQIGFHVAQLRRDEAGTAQPTLDVLRRLAVALSVSGASGAGGIGAGGVGDRRSSRRELGCRAERVGDRCMNNKDRVTTRQARRSP